MKLFTEQELKTIVKEEEQKVSENNILAPKAFDNGHLYYQINEKLMFNKIDANQKSEYQQLFSALATYFICGNHRKGLHKLTTLFKELEDKQKIDFRKIDAFKNEIIETNTSLIPD